MKSAKMIAKEKQGMRPMAQEVSNSSRQAGHGFHEQETGETSQEKPIHPLIWVGGQLVWYTGVFVCVLVLLGAALYHIWSQSQAIQMGFTYSRLMQQHKTMNSENNQLKLSVNKLLSSHRLAQIGRQELGMQRQQPSQMISEAQVRQMFGMGLQGTGVRLARAKTKRGFAH